MGRVISRKYEELGQLGQGGQGVVFKVRHVEQKTIFALKALPAYLLEDQDMVARFEQESVVMTRLQHRNIARVLGTGRDDALNLSYFVMEYIQGRTLKQYVYEKGPLPLPEVLEIARQVASALDYAHHQTPPVIHRDIKPTNIMIEDHTGRAVLLDFGIAKELDNEERSRTKTGVMVGTWKYCSPEQLRHEPLSGSADVYSLGIVMYEIFTGKQFFAGLDEHAVLGKVLYEPQENIPSFDRPVPPAFASLITKAIAKARDKRYPRMADLLNDLEACWWALDETKTVVLSTPNVPPQPEYAQTEIEKIEEQIRQLEEERQRRLLVPLQGQVREAREQAEKEGARQVAEALFEQGLTQERIGEEQGRNHQYVLAQRAYQEALQSFTRAAEEAASAILWRQAEQSRQEATNASTDAERYRARELAPTAYTSALAAQARAEHAWEQRQYAQARTLYEKARDLFEDARDLAYRQTLKEEAKAAQTQAQASKHAAVAESAETLAQSVFEEARASEQRAIVALGREEFTQAREFFLVAQQKYEQAQRQALRVQQRRQEVVALAEEVQVAQQRAQAEGSEVEQQQAYQQAEMFRQQAAALLVANEFTGAQQIFVQAQEHYEAAAQAVARARLRQQVTRVRREADAARAGAEAAGAQRWFQTEWTAGQQEEDVGRSRETQGELAAAIECYRQVAQRWERLRQAAFERTAQELTETVRQQTQSARKVAQHAAAESLAATRFQQGGLSEQQAEEACTRKDFGAAQELYEQARRQYEQATDEAQEETLRQNALQAAQDVHAAQHLVSTVTKSSGAWGGYQQAVAMQKQAETLVTQRQYSQAIQAYTQARTHYEEAARITERERQQATLNLARQQLETARTAAEQGGAPQRFATAWREAEAVVRRARQHEERGVLHSAATVYQEAGQRFTQLQREAQEQAAQEHALAVQERVRRVKEQAQPFRPQAEVQWHAAQEQESQGNAALQARNYARAAASYAQAEVEYQRARTEGVERQRQEAEEKTNTEALLQQTQQARSATEQAKDQAEKDGAREHAAASYSQAATLHAQAEALWQRQSYREALSRYTDAQQCYQEAQTHAQQERLREQAHTAKEQAQRAYDGAQRAGAPDLVREVFAEARTHTQRAERALSAEEFLAAAESYRAAREQYQRASQDAQTESVRREAATSAQLTKTAQQRAVAFGKRVETNPSYRQAKERHQQAEQRFQVHEYESAKQEYEQARTLYDVAVHEAEQELQSIVTQAREATEKARRGAERHEAPQRLADQWAVLLKAEEHARSSEARGDFVAAMKAWQELEVQYVDVRETALEHIAQERVALLQQQVRAAKEDAKEWQPWAESVWGEAVRQETAADQAFQAHRYGDAEQGYRQAARAYARVKKEGETTRHATQETLRQQAEHAQQAAMAAKTEAERNGARERASADYQRALAAYQQGDALLAQQQYQRAEACYLDSERLYTESRQRAQTEAWREEAIEARQQLQIAREAAVSVQAQELAATDFAAATQLATQGEAAQREEAFARARDAYREARQRYEHAQRTAYTKRQQRDTTAVAQAVQSARQRVENAQVWPEVQEVYTQAGERSAQADALVNTQKYEQAQQLYRQAQERYEEAARVAEMRRLKQEVMATRQRAEAARHTAEQADAAPRFSSAWQDANRVLQRAQHHEARSEWREAMALYEEGARQFSSLQHEAERATAYEEEQRQRRAHLAQQRAAQSQHAAEHVDGQHVAQTQYATAMQVYQAGERSLAARQWADAETFFEQAHEQFFSLAAFAQSEQAKRLATTAREEALSAHQEMQKSRTPELFPQHVAEINALLRDGEHDFQRNEFFQAHQKFQQGVDQLRQLAQATARQEQKEHAEQVKAQALALQSQLHTVKGAQHKQAKKAVQQGDRLVAQEQYREAVSHYETAVTLWTALQHTAAAAPEPSAPTNQKSVSGIPSPVPRTNVGYAILGGAVVILLIGLYFVNPFRETSQQSRTPLVKQEVPPKTVDQQPPVQNEIPKTETALAPVPEKFPAPAPKPPQITQATPDPAGEVAVEEGKNQTFVIVADSAAPTTLRYVWQMNGKEVFSGTGKEAAAWTYHPGFDEGGEQPKAVEVVVTDEGQQSVRRNWRVQVRNINRAPRLLTTSPQPGKPLTARAGEIKEFAIEASDPDKDDRLAYVWSVDGKEVARENRWQFRIPPGGGTHTVSVAVSDQGGAKLQQDWLVSLKSLPPTITKTMPASGKEVVIEEGKPLTFAVVADNAGKGTLRYSWLVDGKVQAATGPQWTYTPRFSDGAEQPKQIKVIVTDSDNQAVVETWQVRAREINQPPSIVRASPGAERAVEVTAGGVQDFTVKATDPDRDDRLAYVWSLDGQEVARSERWQFRAPVTEGSHQVRVEIQDRKGMKQQQIWQVLVKAVAPPPEPQPPVWSTVDPRTETLTVQAGEGVTLAAAAELVRQDPATKLAIRYLWTLNNEPAQTSQSERFRFNETTPDTYQVAVVAIAPTGLKSSPRRWTITVRPREMVVPPPSVSGKTELREAEVREWLENYRHAWESKNTDQLVSWGVLSTQDATKLQQVLKAYSEFRVALSDVDIQAQGTQATVSFKRVDTMDRNTVPHPNRTTIRLEKRTDGRIVVRK